MINVEAWMKRADEVIASSSNWNYAEGLQFATSMITAFYGASSPQMATFRTMMERSNKTTGGVAEFQLSEQVKGTLQNIKAELQSGLIKSIRALLTGEIIAELLVMAKQTLADSSEAAKNVSAVLVASAFEDLIRRMGAEFAGVADRPKLEEVITTLKQKDVLKGGEPTTALGYLKFRNDSLHADWKNVERSQALSCLAFTEALLTKHFS
jgi:hypothetical protein